MDSRGVAPVVGKLLAAGVAVLYIAGTTSLLLGGGGVVPEYRTAAGEELSERVLAEAAAGVERAVPDSEANVDGQVRTDLPVAIRDTRYALVLHDETLVLDHPDDRLDARTNLSVPSRVDTVESSWKSGNTFVVTVSDDGTNQTVQLEER